MNENTCQTCINYTTKESLQIWIDGKDNDSKLNQKLIKKKINTNIKPTAHFRIYPTLNSVSQFARKYITFEDDPHYKIPQTQNKNKKKLFKSQSCIQLHTNSLSKPRYSLDTNHSKSSAYIPTRGSKVHSSCSRSYILRKSTRSFSKDNTITTSQTIENNIKFRSINLAQIYHENSERKNKEKIGELRKIERKKYISQLYKLLPSWLEIRLKERERKMSKWDLLRESLDQSLLTFTAKPRLNDKVTFLRLNIRSQILNILKVRILICFGEL